MKEILLRTNQNLLFAVLITVILYFGKVLLVPMVFGALLAMLMAPVCRSLDEKGLNRGLSTAICILILLFSILAILAIIVAQIASFTEDISQLKIKTDDLLYQVQGFIEKTFNIPKQEQVDMAKEQVKNGQQNGGGLAGQILTGITSTIATLVLMLVYCFLFLYNKEKYETFFVKLFHEEDTDKVKNVVAKIAQVGQKYLTGRAMSVLILTTLYSIALLIIGLENAILLAGIAALLTIIPYVGSTLGGFFPFLMALITEDSFHPALMVALAIFIIQTIDNYFIEPNVVGGEVNLSALASILSIIMGGLIWGIPGMILFLPMVGIFKIVFDHVEGLKPLGYVIGDNNGHESSSRIRQWIREKLGIRKKEEQ